MSGTIRTAEENSIIGNTEAPMENLSQREREKKKSSFLSFFFQARSEYFLTRTRGCSLVLLLLCSTGEKKQQRILVSLH